MPNPMKAPRRRNKKPQSPVYIQPSGRQFRIRETPGGFNIETRAGSRGKWLLHRRGFNSASEAGAQLPLNAALGAAVGLIGVGVLANVAAGI